MYTVFQDMHVIRPFWGGEPGETVVFDTVIVSEIGGEYVELTDVGGVFQLLDFTIPANVYSVPGYA
jgi:hypothetical protein